MVLDDVFTRGGRHLVDVLEYLVISRQTDLVFLFLVGEYRLNPTAERAIALFDVFCSPRSPVQITVKELVPPKDMRLQFEVEKLRPSTSDADEAAATTRPPKYLFDVVATRMEKAASKSVERLEKDYDLERAPIENMPGGEMTAGQRWFVDNVWQPQLRPQLVGAGFRRISNIA